MKKLALFGAGDIAKQAFEVLGEDLVAFFFVNNKKEDKLYNVDVLTFDEFLVRKEEVYIIVASTDYANEMAEQLQQYGINSYFLWDKLVLELFSMSKLSLLPRYSPLYYGDDWSTKPYSLIRSFFQFDFSKYHAIALYVYPETASVLIQLLKLVGAYEKVILVMQYGFMVEKAYEFIRGKFDCLLCAVRREDDEISNIYEYIDNVNVLDLFNVLPFLPEYHSPKLVKYKDAYKGKRCFIIGNGPSLSAKDLDVLHSHNEICFAGNNIHKLFDETSWRPDFYVCNDVFVLKANTKNILNVVPKEATFLNYAFCNGHILLINEDKVIPIVHCYESLSTKNIPRFSRDVSKWYNSSFQIVYFMLQAAYYMGFEEVFLLGCDGWDESGCSSKRVPHFYDNDKQISDFISNETSKIFSEVYENHSVYAQLHFKAAKIVFEREGRKVFNATRGGHYEIFKRVDFNRLFSNEVK